MTESDVANVQADAAARATAYLTFQFRGTVEQKDIRNRQNRWYNDDQFDPATPILWDLRDCSPGVTFIDIDASAKDVAGRTEAAHRTGRAAILVSSDLMEKTVHDMMRAIHWRHESKLFRSLDHAIDWLTRSD